MILLELKERQRQLKVVRDKIPQVPELADKVIALNDELEKKKMEVQKLSESIEDPEMHPNKQELKGEDPD